MAVSCILLGAPGSGKGTQAKRLEASFSIPHISTGDMLRAEVASGSELGKRVKETISAGNLVDDKLMAEVIAARFSQADVKKGFILDGYPRNLAQAETIAKILKDKSLQNPKLIYLKIPTDALIERLIGRLTCAQCGSVFHMKLNPPKKSMICDKCGGPLAQRKDDTEETVRNRISIFEKETAALMKHYGARGELVEVDGMQSVDQVTAALKKALGQ